MKLKHLHYAVEFVVEMTGRDLNMFQQLSQHHYDGKCQSVSRQGGFLYGMLNHHNSHANAVRHADLLAYGPADQPTPFLDEVTEHHLTWDQVDTLCKIAEMEQYVPPGKDKTVNAFEDRNFTCHQMLKRARDASEALNTDNGREAVEDMATEMYAARLGMSIVGHALPKKG